MSIADPVPNIPVAPQFDRGDRAASVSPAHAVVPAENGAPPGSHRCDCNNAIGVPAGTDGSLMSIADPVPKSPVAPQFDRGDGAASVSPAHTPAADDTCDPPAFTRYGWAPEPEPELEPVP